MFLLLQTKRPQQDFAGLSAQEGGSTVLSLHGRLTEKGLIVLNGRKWAFINQTSSTARAATLLRKGRDGQRMRAWGLCCVPSPILFCSLGPFSSNHSAVSETTPTTTGHLCGPKLMGSCPKDGPVATICLFVNIQHAQAKPSCGYANVRCPGASHRDANLRQGPTEWSVENDSWILSV